MAVKIKKRKSGPLSCSSRGRNILLVEVRPHCWKPLLYRSQHGCVNNSPISDSPASESLTQLAFDNCCLLDERLNKKLTGKVRVEESTTAP